MYKKVLRSLEEIDKEIYELMFRNEYEFNWEDFEDEDNCYYTGNRNKDNYLLIEYDNKIVGSISHSFNQTETPNFELDIWLRSKEYTGKGIGTKVINILVEYLNKEYRIDTFIIRPWSKNLNAIKSYKKCGFVIDNNFNPYLYYGEDAEEWGEGDYGDETVNMVKRIYQGNQLPYEKLDI